MAHEQSFLLRTSPHIHAGTAVPVIMRNVVYALLPVCAFSVYVFGLSALVLMLCTTVVCVLTEHVICLSSKKPSSVSDWSAVITGLLLALTLPPGFPLWMACVGSLFSIVVGKAIFGGLGFNLFNPALVGRAFLQAAFPVAITTWTPGCALHRFIEFIPSTLAWPLMSPPSVVEWSKQAVVDGFSGATPLALQKFDHVTTEVPKLFFGMTAGSSGETCAILILLCGAYLVVRKFMNWRIPAAMLLSAFIFSALFYWADPAKYPSPLFTLFSGGLMLGAVFMASDMVASPVTPLGVWIYGALMGFFTVIIRLKGGLPEGVMYAILLGNALSPHIDNLTQPRVYGTSRKRVKP
ncbi:MAG TPA: RnfABCDGE type electron transport complex subunit D [Candidatus Hydrogenedentes bacterium]|nr:RnfABCDGE type electron transport complex subunit D [Candidatus Hydrogenedentota bacterium]